MSEKGLEVVEALQILELSGGTAIETENYRITVRTLWNGLTETTIRPTIHLTRQDENGGSE